jgi:hypothetical protein
MSSSSFLRRGIAAGLASALLIAVGFFVMGLTATPAVADTVEPTLIPARTSSDPEIQQCSDSATGWSGLCLFTSNDLGTHGPSFDWVYPMESTYLYTMDSGLDPSLPSSWQDRGAIFTESQIPWAGRYPDGTLPQHLWAPTHASFQGMHYLLVPEITDVTQVHTSSRIAIARSSSLFGGYTYLGAYDIGGYASDPAIFFKPQQGREPAPIPFLVYADGDGDTCGGLTIAQLDYQNITAIAGSPQPIAINGLAENFGTSGPGCAGKGRPYLEGASLYHFGPDETGSATGSSYYLIFAVKPEGGFHGASQEVIAYATASSVWGPYTYQGIIMEGSSTEWTNQASIQKYGDHYLFAYHDGTSANGLPARKVRGACLTFQRGLINKIERSTDGFARCNAIQGTIALRSRGNGQVVVAGNFGAADLSASSGLIGGWEKFDVVPRNGGRLALRAHANGKFVSSNHSLGALNADATGVGPQEEFALTFNANGTVSILNNLGHPVAPVLSSNSTTLIDSWTPKAPTVGSDFDILPFRLAFGLRSLANGRFVAAPNAGVEPLIAAGATGALPDWQDTFTFENQADGFLAMRWAIPNQLVCAENAGSSSLIANRTAVGLWEEYLLLWNSDRTFSLQARVNNRFVAAENAGGSPLIANRTEVGLWERFYLIDTAGMRW